MLFGIVEWALAQLGSVVLKRPDLPGAAWWPAAGLAVVVLLRVRFSRWWALLLTAIAVAVLISNRQVGSSWWVSMTFALANVAECGVTAAVFRGHRDRRTNAFALSDVRRFAFAAGCGLGVASSIIATRAYLVNGTWIATTRGFALSHGLGLLLFTPALLLIPEPSLIVSELRAGWRNAEWSVQLALGSATAWWAFESTTRLPVAFIVVFPLLWGAARLGPVRAMLSATLVSVVVTVGTLNGLGPFAAIADHEHRLWVLQLLLVAVSAAVLVLVLGSHARDQVTEALAEREASLAQAQRLAQVGSWTRDVSSDRLSWSPELFRITGTDPATHTPTLASLEQMMLPEDRAHVAVAVARATVTGDPYEVEYRIRRPDGQVRRINGRAQVHLGRHGKPVSLQGIAQDVTESRAAAQALAEARDLFAGVLNSATEQVIIGTDLAGVVTVFNVGAVRILGYPAEEMIGRLPTEIYEPQQIIDRAAELGIPAGPEVFAYALNNGARSETRQWTYLTRDGRAVQILLTATAMRDSTGAVNGYIGIGTDVTEQRRTERALADSEQRFRLAFASSSVGMYMTSLDPSHPGRILRANQAMADLLGVTVTDLVGRTVLDITHPSDVHTTQAHMEDLIRGTVSTIRREKAFLRNDGEPLWTQLSLSTVASDGERYVMALAEDITARKHAEQSLRQQSLHDPLTGLANRVLFRDRLEHALAAATRTACPVGVLYVDLDGFKQVNDSAGHGAGDALLTQVAARLRAATRPGDTVARLGGDEFAMVCPELTDLDGLRTIAGRILGALGTVFELSTGPQHISASIGISLSGPDSTPETLLADADAGMYNAKKAGKNRLAATRPEDLARAARAARLGTELDNALAQQQFIMHGQPVVDLATGATIAVETLIRWNHPTRGVLPPGEFLDVAEQSPLMIAIGQRVLAESCRMAAAWTEQIGPGAPDVHINISGRQLESGSLTRDVLDALSTYNLPADRLILELTETHMPAITASLRTDLERLRDRGIRIAIDDLGTGYSSLARITDLPVDILKIDLSFVAGLGRDTRCDAVVRALLSLGQTLGLTVVAEGVETPQQAQLLLHYGCDTAQGYLYSPARPERELLDYLRTTSRTQRTHTRDPAQLLSAASSPAAETSPHRRSGGLIA